MAPRLPSRAASLSASAGDNVRSESPRSGFTIIELMVVLTVASVLLVVALPGLRDIMIGQQLKSMTFDLTADLILARSEALKRNNNVSLSAVSTNWNQGWIITADASGERLAEREAGSAEVIFVSAPTRITFDANGRVIAPTTQLRQTLRVGSGAAISRCVALDLSGRAQSSKGACS